MKRPLSHPMRLICALLAVCALLSCGLTAFAAEESLPVVKHEPYPADVQTITEDTDPSWAGRRQIVKTYILTPGEDPADIPRDSFTSDGWRYEFSDVTQSKTSGTDARPHVEKVEISTDSNILDEITGQLDPTLEYESEDGYCGLLTLDLASVKSEATEYKDSSYTVTATREYPNLPANDLYYIPKNITDNGRTLALDGVEWEAQTATNVGYTDIPDSYRAVAKYTGKAFQSVAIGYITTADYTGEITKEIPGDTVYKVYFTGKEINPTPLEPEPEPDVDSGSIPIVLIIGVVIVVMACAGAAVFYFLHHNVKVYSVGEDGYRIMVAKDRISVKKPVIDLTPLDNCVESRFFSIVIGKSAAKSLNGKTIDVIFASVKLTHQIAYEGDTYKIEANFHDMTIKAIY